MPSFIGMASAVLNPMPPNVPRETVRVLGQDLYHVGTVGLDDPHRPRRAHAVAVKKTDLADDFLLGPGIGNPPGPDAVDAEHLAQLLERRLYDVEHLLAERADQLAGVDGRRWDRCPGSCRNRDISGCPRSMTGRNCAESAPRTAAVRAVVDPVAGCSDPFADRYCAGMAYHSDQVAMAPRLDPQNAEPVVWIVEGDALDQPSQDLAVGRSRAPLVARLHDVLRAGALSSREPHSKQCVSPRRSASTGVDARAWSAIVESLPCLGKDTARRA